jgi:hypothetical protein
VPTHCKTLSFIVDLEKKNKVFLTDPKKLKIVWRSSTVLKFYTCVREKKREREREGERERER